MTGILRRIDEPDTKPPREPPHDLQAEQEVLGAALVDNELAHELAAVAAPTDYWHPAHIAISTAIVAALQAGRLADPVTLSAGLEGEPSLATVGGARVYLTGLAQAMSSRMTATAYAAVVRDLAMRRRAIEVGHRLIAAAHEQDVDADPRDLITAADSELVSLLDGGQASEACSMAATLDATLDAAEAQQSGGAVFRVPTGLAAVDRITGGLPRGGFAVLGGRPSMGKTAVACAIAANVAAAGGGVLFASLEMPRRQLGARWLAAAASISAAAIDRGQLDEDQWRRLDEARQRLRELPLRVIDARAMTPADLRAHVASARRKMQVDLIVVDYLQLVRPPRLMRDNAVREATEVSNALADLFGSVDAAGLCLSQLSRQVEARSDKRPQLSDLRETGAIEQDADLVMFGYRDAYYLERQRPGRDADQARWAAWRRAMEIAGGEMELAIGKNRQGPIGNAMLGFDPATGRVFDLPDADGAP
ncbi:MAG: DnaB-like helicase C-terminal domain-containing protein [Sneathiellaceae bacterium]